jgi:hypothetical protein
MPPQRLQTSRPRAAGENAKLRPVADGAGMAITKSTQTIVVAVAVSVLAASLLAIFTITIVLPQGRVPESAPAAEAPPRLTEPTLPGTKQMMDAVNRAGWQRDYGGAIAVLAPGAERGYSDAMYWLGRVYEMQRDYQKSTDLFRRASDKGNPYATRALADAYFHGDGVEHDLAEAVRLWRIAATAGVAGAQVSMGVAYEQGWGGSRDLVAAYAWYAVAAGNTNPTIAERAAYLRDQVRRELTQAERVAARRRLAEWYVQ